jgi:diacylglycerol kinase family enzyme
MEVTLVRHCSRFEVTRQFLRLLRGTHLGHPAITFRSAVDLHLDAPHPVLIQADGDVVGTTPARITLRPAALRMLLPPV